MFSVNIVHLFKFFFMGKKKKVLKGRVKKVESCLDKINQLDPVIQGLGKQKRTAGGGVLSLVENLHESFFVEEFEAVVGYVKGVEDLIMDREKTDILLPNHDDESDPEDYASLE